MKIHEGDEKITKQLEAKEARLKRILQSEYPTDPAKKDAHIRKIINAERFLDELSEAKAVVGCGVNLKLVPRPTFEKQVDKADFATMEFDGEFCKVAIILNYPYDNLWLIYVAPVESI